MKMNKSEINCFHDISDQIRIENVHEYGEKFLNSLPLNFDENNEKI